MGRAAHSLAQQQGRVACGLPGCAWQHVGSMLAGVRAARRHRAEWHSELAPPDAGSWLLEQRRRRGLAAADLAALLGVATWTVLRWERGEMRPSPARWQALQDLFA